MKREIPFIGRQSEISKLQQVADKRVAGLVVLRGRRRIGKTPLAQEFGKRNRMLLFSGLPINCQFSF